MEKREDPFSVDIKQVLLNMRKYRMGLIQTPDQLRFSYMAVIEGAKYIMGDSTIQVDVLNKFTAFHLAGEFIAIIYEVGQIKLFFNHCAYRTVDCVLYAYIYFALL